MLTIAKVFELTRGARHPCYLVTVADEGVAVLTPDVPTRQTAGVRGDVLQGGGEMMKRVMTMVTMRCGDEEGDDDGEAKVDI